MFNKVITYEVLIGESNRWVLDSEHRAKTIAMTRAQSLLESNQHDAVKVLRLENDANEEVVFQQESANKIEKPITISAIEESALCNEPDDLCGYEARKTTGRLLRQYLDEWGITALELLHDYGHIRQLVRMETLYNQALHRAASIQARTLGEDPSSRNDTLFSLAAKVEKRARLLDDLSPSITLLQEKGLAAVLADIAEKAEPKQLTYLTCAVLAKYLGQKGDWKQKLLLVIDLLERETDETALVHLDQVCAEILDGSEAVKDLLGPQADLMSALSLMVDLSAGNYKKGARSETPLGRFNAVMRNRSLPYSQGVLTDRVARAISGTNPLTRGNDETDKQAFLSLFKKLIGRGGLKGGIPISDAVTRRIRMVLKNSDEDLSPDAGIAAALGLLPHRAQQIGYLLDLNQSDFGIKYQMGVLKPLLKILETVSSLEDLLPSGASRDDIIQAVGDMRRRIGTGVLGEEIGPLIDQKLDRLLKGLEPEEPAAVAPAPTAPERKAKGDLDTRVFEAGDIIFNEGDAGDEAYMIVSGEVEISITSGERRVVIATLERGQIMGEMALIDHQPRMATAKALANTVLTVIPQEVFRKRLDWLAGEDRLISHLLEIFVSRLRKQAGNLS